MLPSSVEGQETMQTAMQRTRECNKNMEPGRIRQDTII